MRKIRLFIASSLDGYIARTSAEVDWLFTDSDYGYNEFFAQIDTVLMGSKTYHQVLTFGEYPYKVDILPTPIRRGIPRITSWAFCFHELTCLKEFPHPSIGQSHPQTLTFPCAPRYEVLSQVCFVQRSNLYLEYVHNANKYAS